MASDDSIWLLATALAGALSPDDVAGALAEQGAAAAGASFSNMATLDPKTGRVRVVHNSDMDPEIAGRWGEFDLSAPTPLTEAMRTRSPVLIESLSQMEERFPALVPDSVATDVAATASIPLTSASGTMLGAAGFGWAGPQLFAPHQMRTLEFIANLTAQALERALLHEREHERRDQRERADAQLLQDAFLPRVLPQTDTLDVAAIYLPASDASMGGDWYDVFPVEGGTCLVIG